MEKDSKMKYVVNNKSVFESKDVNGGLILSKDQEDYKFLYNEVVYDVKLLQYDEENKTYKLKINGFHLEVNALNELDQLIAKLGFNKPSQKTLKEITAPMPGLVKKIFVGEGDEIVVGQNLFILEAMKMENIIKASGEGIIAKILVQENEKVEKGKVLIKL
jgi:biotin carboxyl carrier protein